MNDGTIGSALTEKRQELGISRVQAAEKVGMSRTTYSSYERDAQRPSVDVFPALATFLNMTIEEFLVLYGATAIATLRPSLERVLSELDVQANDVTASIEEETVRDEPYWLGSATPVQDTSEVPDIPDVSDVPDVPELSNFLEEMLFPSIRTG